MKLIDTIQDYDQSPLVLEGARLLEYTEITMGTESVQFRLLVAES